MLVVNVLVNLRQHGWIGMAEQNTHREGVSALSQEAGCQTMAIICQADFLADLICNSAESAIRGI